MNLEQRNVLPGLLDAGHGVRTGLSPDASPWREPAQSPSARGASGALWRLSVLGTLAAAAAGFLLGVLLFEGYMPGYHSSTWLRASSGLRPPVITMATDVVIDSSGSAEDDESDSDSPDDDSPDDDSVDWA